MPAPFLSSVTVQPDGRTVLYVYTAAVTLVGAPPTISLSARGLVALPTTYLSGNGGTSVSFQVTSPSTPIRLGDAATTIIPPGTFLDAGDSTPSPDIENKPVTNTSLVRSTVPASTSKSDAPAMLPASVTSDWVQVINPGGMIVVDAAAINNPSTQILDPLKQVLDFRFAKAPGTLVCASMGYTGTQSGTAPQVAAFGRTVSLDGNTIGRWELLPNLQSTTTTSVTLTATAASDVVDLGYSWTPVDPLIHRWDRCGCNQVIWGLQITWATTVAALAAQAVLWAKGL